MTAAEQLGARLGRLWAAWELVSAVYSAASIPLFDFIANLVVNVAVMLSFGEKGINTGARSDWRV